MRMRCLVRMQRTTSLGHASRVESQNAKGHEWRWGRSLDCSHWAAKVAEMASLNERDPD